MEMRNPRKKRRRWEQCWRKAKTRLGPFPRLGLEYSVVSEVIRKRGWFKIWPRSYWWL